MLRPSLIRGGLGENGPEQRRCGRHRRRRPSTALAHPRPAGTSAAPSLAQLCPHNLISQHSRAARNVSTAAVAGVVAGEQTLTITRPDDWHLHVRDGQPMRVCHDPITLAMTPQGCPVPHVEQQPGTRQPRGRASCRPAVHHRPLPSRPFRTWCPTRPATLAAPSSCPTWYRPSTTLRR
jgi:hypothetical protein